MTMQEVKTNLNLSALEMLERAHKDSKRDDTSEAYFRGYADGVFSYLQSVRTWLNQLNVDGMR